MHCKDYDYDEEEVIIDLTFKEGITGSLQYYFFNNKLLLSEFLCKGYDIKVNNDTKYLSSIIIEKALFKQAWDNLSVFVVKLT